MPKSVALQKQRVNRLQEELEQVFERNFNCIFVTAECILQIFILFFINALQTTSDASILDRLTRLIDFVLVDHIRASISAAADAEIKELFLKPGESVGLLHLSILFQSYNARYLERPEHRYVDHDF